MVDRLATVLWFVLKMFQIIIHRLHIWPLRRIVPVSQSVSQSVSIGVWCDPEWSTPGQGFEMELKALIIRGVCCYGIDLNTIIVRLNQ